MPRNIWFEKVSTLTVWRCGPRGANIDAIRDAWSHTGTTCFLVFICGAMGGSLSLAISLLLKSIP